MSTSHTADGTPWWIANAEAARIAAMPPLLKERRRPFKERPMLTDSARVLATRSAALLVGIPLRAAMHREREHDGRKFTRTYPGAIINRDEIIGSRESAAIVRDLIVAGVLRDVGPFVAITEITAAWIDAAIAAINTPATGPCPVGA